MNEPSNQENRGKQIAVGGAIIFTFMGLVICLLSLWRFIPGWVGESVGMFAGLISSPFILEASFIVMGFFIVIGLNTWRRNKNGDDFVTYSEEELVAKPKIEDHKTDR